MSVVLRDLVRRVLAIGSVLAVVSGVAGVLVVVAASPASAAPPSISGYATNFDVPNGTDKECQGFEVEIEDITDTQVTYTWPGTPGYPNPYGPAPTSNIVNTTFPDGHSGVRIKFVATYVNGAWSAKTPIGAIDHFGVHVSGTAGAQRYTWLCDLGGSAAGSTGSLTEYGGTTQGNFYPTPSVPSVAPVIVSTPTGEGVQPTVTPAVPPAPAEARFPTPVWVLKYQASSPNPVDVNQLLITDPEVQNAINNNQISSVAELFQPDPGTAGTETEPPDPVNPGDAASVTVTQTFQFTGPVDPVDNSITCNEIVGDPNNCNNFVGPMIARQMQSTQLTNTTPRAPINVSVLTGTIASGTGGNVTSGALPGNADPATIDCGSDGGSCFTNVDNPSTVTLTATPNAGYDFVKWGGACAGTTPTCNVSVNGAKAATATFALSVIPTSVTPAALGQGVIKKPVTIAGSGFAAGAKVTLSGTGVTVGTVSATATAVHTTLTVAASAPPGQRDLTITNPNGHSGTCSGCLTIDATPTITSVPTPTVGIGAINQIVNVTGSNFATGAKAVISGTGVTVKTTVVSNTQLRLTVTAALTAAPGNRDLTVTNLDGGKTTCTGCVTADPAPTLTGLNPNAVSRGATTTIALTGTNLLPGATAKTSGTGITVGVITWVSPTEIDVTFVVAPAALVGPRTVTLTNPDGGHTTLSGLTVH